MSNATERAIEVMKRYEAIQTELREKFSDAAEKERILAEAARLSQELQDLKNAKPIIIDKRLQ